MHHIPPASPFSLIQEHLWPNEWLILVCCQLLNRTSRKQVEKILPHFIKKWSSPQLLLKSNKNDVELLIKSLGFSKKRTDLLFKMSEEYLHKNWNNASELPGIGKYGSAAHDIFCKGIVSKTPPNDHALKKYVEWYHKNYESKND